jgi:hypothetical protein
MEIGRLARAWLVYDDERKERDRDRIEYRVPHPTPNSTPG